MDAENTKVFSFSVLYSDLYPVSISQEKDIQSLFKSFHRLLKRSWLNVHI